MNIERNETIYCHKLPNNLSKIFLWNTVSDIIIFRIFCSKSSEWLFYSVISVFYHTTTNKALQGLSSLSLMPNWIVWLCYMYL